MIGINQQDRWALMFRSFPRQYTAYINIKLEEMDKPVIDVVSMFQIIQNVIDPYVAKAIS